MLAKAPCPLAWPQTELHGVDMKWGLHLDVVPSKHETAVKGLACQSLVVCSKDHTVLLMAYQALCVVLHLVPGTAHCTEYRLCREARRVTRTSLRVCIAPNQAHLFAFAGLQVEEGAMYGILSSKRHHTFIRRPSDAANRNADFSKTFDSQTSQSPSVRMIYLYLLHLAQDAPHLDPRLRPTTAAELKWVTENHKRRRLSSESNGDDDSDQSEWGDANSGLGHTEHDDDATESEGTTDANALAAQTGAQVAKYVAVGSSKSTGRRFSNKTACHQQHRAYLEKLSLVARPQLELSSIKIGRSCVVRHVGLPAHLYDTKLVPACLHIMFVEALLSNMQAATHMLLMHLIIQQRFLCRKAPSVFTHSTLLAAHCLLHVTYCTLSIEQKS